MRTGIECQRDLTDFLCQLHDRHGIHAADLFQIILCRGAAASQIRNAGCHRQQIADGHRTADRMPQQLTGAIERLIRHVLEKRQILFHTVAEQDLSFLIQPHGRRGRQVLRAGSNTVDRVLVDWFLFLQICHPAVSGVDDPSPIADRQCAARYTSRDQTFQQVVQSFLAFHHMPPFSFVKFLP